MLYIVDDDVETGELLKAALFSITQDIEIFSDPQAFLVNELTRTDILLLDLMMPDFDGVEVIRYLAENSCEAAIVLMSGYDYSVLHSVEKLAKDKGLSVQGNLTKPIVISKLRQMVGTILERFSNYEIESCSDFMMLPNDDPEHLILTNADLKTALLENQLVLFYQPQIQMKTHVLLGFEGLVRWFHPEYGMIYPSSFIPLAEQSGLIEELTHVVLRIAIAQCTLWKRQGVEYRLSVNLSAENINSLKLPEDLMDLFSTHHLQTSKLVLEVTESALMADANMSADILTRLRLKGFPLSIDDFGTGYSSLSQLHRIPFTELKIDQSFVMTIMEDPDSLAIVDTCIMLGHKLHMEVVAEGIESEEIYNKLEAMGCDIAQGYYIAKPIPPQELDEWCNNYLMHQSQRDFT